MSFFGSCRNTDAGCFPAVRREIRDRLQARAYYNGAIDGAQCLTGMCSWYQNVLEAQSYYCDLEIA